MEKAKCPFLELTTVTFCKAFPVKKMIPVDKSASDKGVCNSTTFRECPAYREINNPEIMVENVRGFLLKPDFYFHPRHLWVSIAHESEGEARVGIDDFSQKLIGKIDRISVPPEGAAVRENGICLLLHSGTRTVRMVAPGDGIIRAVNRKVTSDPTLINRDPYNEGWIFSMHVTGEGIKRLFHGSVAKKWFDWEVERLQRMFSSDLGITATDGGESLSDISSRLNEAQWGRIVNLFLG